MVAEREQRYPKGSYRLTLPKRGSQAGFSAVNLITRERMAASSFWALMRAIDRDLDHTRFPQYTVKLRTWGGKAAAHETALNAGAGSSGTPKPVQTNAPEGGAAYLLRVIHRDNATWQGALQKLDGSPMTAFASELELIKLLG